MEVVLRVKRSRDQDPIDIIALSKKPKTFEDIFQNLSLAPQLVFKRIQKNSDIQRPNPEEIINDLRSNTLSLHSNRIRENRLKIQEKWRHKVFQREDTILCNGEPLVSFVVATGNKENEEIDEYYLSEADEFTKAAGIIDYIHSESGSENEEDRDSEDSNREDHPWNDYPDESDDSEQDYQSSKSEEYEYYEVDE